MFQVLYNIYKTPVFSYFITKSYNKFTLKKYVYIIDNLYIIFCYKCYAHFRPKICLYKGKKKAKIFILAILIMITVSKILREMLFLYISCCTTFTYLFDITSLQQFFQCTFNGRFADVRAKFGNI